MFAHMVQIAREVPERPPTEMAQISVQRHGSLNPAHIHKGAEVYILSGEIGLVIFIDMSGQEIRSFDDIGASRNGTAIFDMLTQAKVCLPFSSTVELLDPKTIKVEAEERMVFANDMVCNAWFLLAMF